MKLRLFILAAFLFSADGVFACTCAPKSTVLDAFDASEIVLTARIASITKAPAAQPTESYYSDDIRSVTVVVEKVYKGDLRVRNELILAQGNGGDCMWGFSEQDVGERFLFYFKRPREGELWVASMCGRSNPVKEATEDLLYLDNLKKRSGKTRVSGKYRIPGGPIAAIANKTITIRGKKETFETQTDETGFFEIYDLPPGEYTLEPELPFGWKLVPDWQRRAGSEPHKSIPFTLPPKKHVTFDLQLEPNTAVEGKIVGPDGNPMSNLCLHLLQRSLKYESAIRDCTDDSGQFRFTGVPPMIYVLVANLGGQITTREPFPTLFYPGVTELEKATPIVVNEGETVKSLNFVIPKLNEKVFVEGVVQFSDESSAPELAVVFRGFLKKGFEGDRTTYASPNGTFRLVLLKGVKGEVYAQFPAKTGEYENCPQLDNLLKTSGEGWVYLKTMPIVIDADENIDYLVLRFPFPKCNRRQTQTDRN